MIAKYKNQKGFTLIETLVAVMILATAVAGPLTIASKSLHNALVAKDEISAFFLAQDALEYIRFVRDSNTLLGANWITGSGGSGTGIDLSPCATANGCYVDSTMSTPGVADVPTACTTATCDPIYYNPSTSLYTYVTTGTNRSIYTRRITLTSITATEYRLTITVSWKDTGNIGRSVQVSENISRWQ